MPPELARLQALIMRSDGHIWIEALFKLQSSQATSVSRDILNEFLALGICHYVSDEIRLTSFGLKCADSAREYIFWVKRNRKFHGEGELPALRLDNFRGTELLEIGAGWGCNLISLSAVTRRAIGLEIEPVYLQLSRLLSTKENVAPPQIVIGRGENIPFMSNSFDWVLLWSSLQYMEIDDTLTECHRVMRKNARVLISIPSLTHAIRGALSQKSRKSIVRIAQVALETAWYQTHHKRLRNSKTSATARPIAVTRAYLNRRAHRIGLRMLSEISIRTDDRDLLVFEKA